MTDATPPRDARPATHSALARAVDATMILQPVAAFLRPWSSPRRRDQDAGR